MIRRDRRGRLSREFLLALGGCDRPDWAVRRGIMLQRQMDAQLCVLSLRARDRRLDGLAAAIGVWEDERRIDTARWARVTAELADTSDYRLLLVGHASRKTVRDHLLGTEVERLLRVSSRPVLVVKAKPIKPYRTALAATNLTPSSFAAALVASRLFPGIRLQLVSSIHAPFKGFLDRETMLPELRTERMAAMRSSALRLAQAARRRVSAGLIDGDFPFAIPAKAQAAGADLLVVGCRSRGILQSWRRPWALDLVEASAVDVLVVPHPQPEAAEDGL